MPQEPSPDLFDAAAESELARRSPLANRLRPHTLDEVTGQGHLLARGAPLRELVESGHLTSAIFFGPPGTGKTTVAMLVADLIDGAFVQLSAVSAGVKDVRDVLEQARRTLGMTGKQTVLFLDEIHRFNRAQQDALLPGVEDGTIVLIGATTENPFFALNAPLLSRMTLFRFESLTRDDLATIAQRATLAEGFEIDPDALERCVDLAEGDARTTLNTLEVAMALVAARLSTNRFATEERAAEGLENVRRIDVTTIDAARTTRALRFSRDEHYDVISAFIKSIRGSDADAGVYWLARLVAIGEDPRFIARRLVILASEDIGNADPMALVVANAAAEALDRVGLPEAALNLSQAVTYLALAPKSNASAIAYAEAAFDVQNLPAGSVPAFLRDAHYQGASQLGHGVGYRYPHDDPRGWIDAAYLPEHLIGRRYYRPVGHGRERELMERLDVFREHVERGSLNVEDAEEHAVDPGDENSREADG